jgi:hypothetical protein
MMSKICAYRDKNLRPEFNCPVCSVPTNFVIQDYYLRPDLEDRDMHLCEAHAKWWNEVHPFGPVATREGAEGEFAR